MISATDKLDPGLSEALGNGTLMVVDKTATIFFPPLHRASFQAVKDSPHRESLKKAALPFSVRLVSEDSVFDL